MKGKIYKCHFVYEVENGKWRRSVNFTRTSISRRYWSKN